ncbi:MAG: B12-binding domain-containing radical SAM protein [Oscillospiraceae bacterium]
MQSNRKSRYLLVRVNYDSRVANVEPLGLEYLAAVIKAEGEERVFHDEALHSRFFRTSRIMNIIEKHQIDFVCFTVMSYRGQYILDLISRIKRRFPQVKILVGGPEVTINPRDFMLPDIDYISYDHGLESFQFGVSCGFDADKLAQSPQATGIAFKKDGQWIEKERRYHVLPDRSLYYENRRRYRIIAKGSFSVMKTAFSCPQKCNFCISRQFNGGVYSERMTDEVIDEIMGIDNDKIWIIDDDFLVGRERVVEICNKLIEKGCRKTFMVFARADSVVKCKDILPLLYKAGFRDMLVGLEAVDDSYLEQYNKNSSVAMNVEAIRLLREHNMLCNGLFVVSNNFTQKDFNKIHSFIKKQGLVWVLFGMLIPFKGTALYEKNKDKLNKYTYHRTDGTHALLPPQNMSKLRYYINFHLLYYINYPRLYFTALTGKYKRYLNDGTGQ